MSAATNTSWVGFCYASAAMFAIGFVFALVRSVRVARASIEATVELEPEARVELPTGGAKIVFLQAPRLISVHGLALRLRGAAGESVQVKRIVGAFLSLGSGQDARVAYARCAIVTPGTYILTASGIPSSPRPMALLFCKDTVFRSYAWSAAAFLSLFGALAALFRGIELSIG